MICCNMKKDVWGFVPGYVNKRQLKLIKWLSFTPKAYMADINPRYLIGDCWNMKIVIQKVTVMSVIMVPPWRLFIMQYISWCLVYFDLFGCWEWCVEFCSIMSKEIFVAFYFLQLLLGHRWIFLIQFSFKVIPLILFYYRTFFETWRD